MSYDILFKVLTDNAFTILTLFEIFFLIWISWTVINLARPGVIPPDYLIRKKE